MPTRGWGSPFPIPTNIRFLSFLLMQCYSHQNTFLLWENSPWETGVGFHSTEIDFPFYVQDRFQRLYSLTTLLPPWYTTTDSLFCFHHTLWQQTSFVLGWLDKSFQPPAVFRKWKCLPIPDCWSRSAGTTPDKKYQAFLWTRHTVTLRRQLNKERLAKLWLFTRRPEHTDTSGIWTAKQVWQKRKSVVRSTAKLHVLAFCIPLHAVKNLGTMAAHPQFHR